jgi:hypothetical protein
MGRRRSQSTADLDAAQSSRAVTAGNPTRRSDLRRPFKRRTIQSDVVASPNVLALSESRCAKWNSSGLRQLIAYDGDLARMDPLHHSNLT